MKLLLNLTKQTLSIVLGIFGLYLVNLFFMKPISLDHGEPPLFIVEELVDEMIGDTN